MPDKRIKVWVQHFKDRPFLVLQWIDPDTGKRKSKSAETADPGKAEEARGDLESDLNNGRYAEASRMTWERFRELFEEEYVAGRRPETRRNYAVMFDLFEQVCGPKQLRSVTERTVSAFAAGLRKLPGRSGGGMMPSTIRVRLQFLHTALQWAAGQKLIAEVPDFPAVKVPRKAPQPVPAESFEKMLAKAGGDLSMRAFLLCGWLAGLRLAEALALRWEENDKSPWVNLAADRIVLPAEFVKADKDQWVPLDPELRSALETLPLQCGKVFTFTNPRGKALTTNGMSHKVKDLARKAGVRLTMKSLRRGFGCRYAGKVPAQVLQKLMRHANIKTTMDYYANVDQAVEEAVLGPKRNSSRNNRPAEAAPACKPSDVNPCPESPQANGKA
jgi:integrase